MTTPLRTLRITLAAFTMIAVSALYLDIGQRIPSSWNPVILSFQFGPALLALFSFSMIAAAGAVVVLILTLLFGRIYCSHLCPLGTLQDIIIWFRHGTLKHRKFPYQRTDFRLHYGITAIVLVVAVAGSMVPVNLLEPFSNFGRILSSLIRPSVIVLNNAAAILGGPENLFGAVRIPMEGISFWTLMPPFIFFAAMILLSIWRGRIFCNLLCPVGGILGLFSRFSRYRITIEGSSCIDCGLCERVCRAQCIDSTARTIDIAACVGCFDCIGSCPTGGMSYEYRRSSQPFATIKEQKDRRAVMLSLSTLVVNSLLIATPADTTGVQETMYDDAKKLPVVPPGGSGKDHFSQFCTGCHRCIAACPTHVLQQSFLEYGWSGLFQPQMDFGVSFCNYDCTVCGEVCPTGAITRLAQAEKKLVQAGTVTFVQKECVVETKKKDCGACAEHCPTKAVKMVPYGKLSIPKIEQEYCVGCGACEHACPTLPRKAIYITPHRIHQTAKLREEKRMDPAEAVPEEFPF